MEAHYRHTQVGWIVLAAMLGIGGFSAAMMLVAELTGGALIVALVSLLLSATFGTLTVTVDDNTLVARFGVGLIRKKVDLSTVRAYEAVRTPWYYGWGIRLYPGGVLYNVSGLDSIEFTLDGGKRCRIGTDEPEALQAAIRQVIGKSRPLSKVDKAQVRRRTRYFAIGILAFLLITFTSVGGIMYAQHHEPDVTVEQDALVIDTLFYGDRYPLSSIDHVELAQTLPRIRVRTNGYALGGKLRGHFKLDRFGDSKLFIDWTVPPYIVMQVDGTYVVVNQEDPVRTRAIYEQLVEAKVGDAP